MSQSNRPESITWPIIGIIFFNFIAYLAVGLPLAVVPGYVHNELGYGTVLAGAAISVQYLATLLSRPHAGRLCDVHGPKRSVTVGLGFCAASGALGIVAALFPAQPAPSLVLLLASRLLLGAGESLVTTGTITWGIGRVGAAHTGKVISWNGITSYGAIALGAPLGVLLNGQAGFVSLGVLTLAMSAISLLLVWRKLPVTPEHGKRLPFTQVMSRVLPFGLCLGLGSMGFGSITAFVTLYFANEHWANPALALTLLGACFILTRVIFADSINRFGGYKVAIASFAIEVLGLGLLWTAGSAAQALAGAAITGLGFSLVFPSLGMEAVKRVPVANRGSALGAYSLFLDLALGLTGPVAGLVAHHAGYAPIYLIAALAAATGASLSLSLYRQSKRDDPL
ncbi:MFS transporter [Chitinimonas naiadis]